MDDLTNQPRKIKIRTVDSNPAGILSFIESSKDLPFSIKRIYYLYDLNDEHSRGFHAHRTLYQCIVAMHGSCELRLEGPAGSFIFNLTRPDEGVLIPPGYWRELHKLNTESVLVVLASDDYNENDYIRNYDEFKAWLKSLSEVRPTPYLDLNRQLIPLKDIENSLMNVVKSGRYINGQNVELFEKEFSDFLGVKYVVGVGNGLDALTLILNSLGVGQNDEVILCAAGFVATALAISRLGAKPVFVDSTESGNLDPTKLPAAITERTKAIIPTHLYGLPADMDAILDAAMVRNIPVIEDACQAHGAYYKNRACGNLGLAAAFSFYPTKNLGALGDGGCVSTHDEELARKVRQLANYGESQRYLYNLLGYNSRLDEIQAAILRIKLSHLPQWNAQRKHFAATYEQALQGIEGLSIIDKLPKTSPCYHVYAVRIKNGQREKLIEYLNNKGIGINIHYPLTIPRQECYADDYRDKSFPEADSWAAETLSLPLAPSHSQAEINHVCNVVQDFFKKKV